MQKYKVKITYDGTVSWYKFGTNKLHRLNGSAVGHADGKEEWWLNGQKLTKKEWAKQISKFNSTDGIVTEIEGTVFKFKLLDGLKC